MAMLEGDVPGFAIEVNIETPKVNSKSPSGRRQMPRCCSTRWACLIGTGRSSVLRDRRRPFFTRSIKSLSVWD